MKLNENDIELEILNIEEDEGFWILNQHQNVPSIIKWKCPVCGYENIRDCRYESFESPPLGSNFIITLICDNHGCKYIRTVELRINMTLSLQNILPLTITEEEQLKKYYKDARFAGKTPLSGEDLKIMRNAQRVFLKKTQKPNILP